ncbi:endo-1,4-beta-xylanase [Pillotina sp. SPG140]|jgi:GH35 family endo-1,4-beta-xylanase
MNSHACDHRKSYLKLHIIGPDGKPLVNQPVQVTQTRHQFLFGVGGFEAVELAGETVHGPLSAERKAFLRDRMDKIFALCNYATLPFYWGRYEPTEGNPDQKRTEAAAQYYADRGIFTKGHPLCWHTVCADWLLQYSNSMILRKQLERIEREVSAFRGTIDKWDVINEVVIMPIFDKYDNAITRVCKDIGRVALIKAVFNAARQANPQATLVLNDFNTTTNYEILIDGCLQAGVPIDVIGIQSHQHQGYWGKDKVLEVLERFSHFGIPIHFTENTIISGDLMPPHIEDLNDWQVSEWQSTPEGEERQKQEIVEMYELLFAHPTVEAITTWDSTDDKWLHAPSGLLHADNSIKPVYTALMQKIKGDWWTTATVTTDGDGNAECYGFRGDYRVSWQKAQGTTVINGKKLEDTVQLV